MARLKTFVSLLAVVGVLLHAGLLARHNGLMLQASLLHNELSAALGVICHSDGTTTQRTSSDPGLPPVSDQGECPICTGLASAAAVLPAHDLPRVATDYGSARIAVVAEIVRSRLAGLTPPPRGPPAHA